MGDLEIQILRAIYAAFRTKLLANCEDNATSVRAELWGSRPGSGSGRGLWRGAGTSARKWGSKSRRDGLSSCPGSGRKG